MKLGLELIFWIFRLTFTNRNKLLLENLALRQQLVVQQRSITRIKLRNQDRFFWSLLSQLWTDWKFNLLSLSLKPLSNGIGKDSNYTGVGSPDLSQVDQR